MKYKTLYYDVTPIAHKLPDDCLQIIIKYAHDELKYNAIKTISPILHPPLLNGIGLSSVQLNSPYLDGRRLYRIRRFIISGGIFYNIEWEEEINGIRIHTYLQRDSDSKYVEL